MEPRRITTNKFRGISSRLARSTADLASKNGRFWAVFGCFQDDRPESSGRSLVCPLAATPWLKIGIQVAQNDREAHAHHGKQVLCGFEPSSPFYGRFSVQKWPFLGCFQDNRPKNSQQSLVCPLAATLWLKIGIQVAQNDREAHAHHGKQVLCRFEPSSPFYGRFSVQKWPFLGCFQDNRPKNSQESLVWPVGDTPWLKTGIQVAQNDRGAKAHDGKQVWCRFKLSSPFYGAV